ncbi:MAG: carbamoyl phosphate synthase small subunit, partial [Gammaproteobacteria bacterium]
LVVQSYCDEHSHYLAQRSLGHWLRSQDIPAMTGVDTRFLTRHLRERGTMSGVMLQDAGSHAVATTAVSVDMEREVFMRVAPGDVVRYPCKREDAGAKTVLLVDVGAKDNIVRSLSARGVDVLRVPWHMDLEPHWMQADGVMIGNGPGDPRHLGELVGQVRSLMRKDTKPVFGICLGNQILALAAGARTYKLPYGHRGVNQPVQDLFTRRSFITSQNHGYAVDDDALPGDWDTWFVNINDGTNEGIRCRGEPFQGVQFHPEASPGPRDTAYLFDDFVKQL